jgi:hypothetical protein
MENLFSNNGYFLDNILTSLSQETHEIIMATFIQQNLGSAVSTNGCSQITNSMQ